MASSTADKEFEGEALPMQGLSIGYLPQEPQLNPEHTVRQAVDVQTQHTDLGAREKAERDVLQDLPLGRHGLGEVVHRKNVLSGRQDRRAGSERLWQVLAAQDHGRGEPFWSEYLNR